MNDDELMRADQSAAEAIGGVLGRAPAPAVELDPELVGRVDRALRMAAEALGVVDVLPPSTEGQPAGPGINPATMAGIVALVAAMQDAAKAGVRAARPYAKLTVDELVTSDAGLRKLAGVLGSIALDEELVADLADLEPLEPQAKPPTKPPPASAPKVSTAAELAAELGGKQ